MSFKLNLDCHLFCLGTFNERYVPDGYFEPMEVDKALEVIGQTEITGFMRTWPTGPFPDDPETFKRMLDKHGLIPSTILIDNFGDRRFKHGGFSTNEKMVKRETIDMAKSGIDFAKACGCESILIWPAHDGMDYPFMADYDIAWGNLVETMTEIGEYAKDMRIAIEPKPQDPRQKMLVNSTGKVMMLINDIGLDNVGAALDVGHSFAAQENPAESCVVLNRHGKLVQVHLNDNYKNADPDMILGSVNFWETLEFFYYLMQTNFQGWCSVDIISGREDRENAFRACVDMILHYHRLASALLERKEDIGTNLQRYSYSDNVKLINSLIFK